MIITLSAREGRDNEKEIGIGICAWFCNGDLPLWL
jgi:hypothetical protein